MLRSSTRPAGQALPLPRHPARQSQRPTAVLYWQFSVGSRPFDLANTAFITRWRSLMPSRNRRQTVITVFIILIGTVLGVLGVTLSRSESSSSANQPNSANASCSQASNVVPVSIRYSPEVALYLTDAM